MTLPIKGSIIFITGATGGVGQALTAAVATRGAAKIYAAGRNVSALANTPGVIPIRLDVTSDLEVDQAASIAADVTLLINNAGVNHNATFMRTPNLQIAREEIEVNYLAPLRMTRAFAPALIKNRGAVLNVLALLARVNFPLMGSYCASKAAALSLTQGLRAELAPKGVRVVAALPGAIDTRLTADLDIPKMTPAEAAAGILDGFEAGEEEIYVGEMARSLAERLASDAKAVERELASGLL
ncbi:SDR family oxidoreductase [Mesorhizobium sp. IMUNJ 23232]|uniref:SDR family oxidoreductase n=1 Tax=Mesorhizobium sp. IMUNJ 23232 TaxID=3376064 RepID=UPI003789B4D2